MGFMSLRSRPIDFSTKFGPPINYVDTRLQAFRGEGSGRVGAVSVEIEVNVQVLKGNIERFCVARTLGAGLANWTIELCDKSGSSANSINTLARITNNNGTLNYMPTGLPFTNQENPQESKLYVVIYPVAGVGAPDTFEIVVEGGERA